MTETTAEPLAHLSALREAIGDESTGSPVKSTGGDTDAPEGRLLCVIFDSPGGDIGMEYDPVNRFRVERGLLLALNAIQRKLTLEVMDARQKALEGAKALAAGKTPGGLYVP